MDKSTEKEAGSMPPVTFVYPTTNTSADSKTKSNRTIFFVALGLALAVVLGVGIVFIPRLFKGKRRDSASMNNTGMQQTRFAYGSNRFSGSLLPDESSDNIPPNSPTHAGSDANWSSISQPSSNNSALLSQSDTSGLSSSSGTGPALFSSSSGVTNGLSKHLPNTDPLSTGSAPLHSKTLPLNATLGSSSSTSSSSTLSSGSSSASESKSGSIPSKPSKIPASTKAFSSGPSAGLSSSTSSSTKYDFSESLKKHKEELAKLKEEQEEMEANTAQAMRDIMSSTTKDTKGKVTESLIDSSSIEKAPERPRNLVSLYMTESILLLPEIKPTTSPLVSCTRIQLLSSPTGGRVTKPQFGIDSNDLAWFSIDQDTKSTGSGTLPLAVSSDGKKTIQGETGNVLLFNGLKAVLFNPKRRSVSFATKDCEFADPKTNFGFEVKLSSKDTEAAVFDKNLSVLPGGIACIPAAFLSENYLVKKNSSAVTRVPKNLRASASKYIELGIKYHIAHPEGRGDGTLWIKDALSEYYELGGIKGLKQSTGFYAHLSPYYAYYWVVQVLTSEGKTHSLLVIDTRNKTACQFEVTNMTPFENITGMAFLDSSTVLIFTNDKGCVKSQNIQKNTTSTAWTLKIGRSEKSDETGRFTFLVQKVGTSLKGFIEEVFTRPSVKTPEGGDTKKVHLGYIVREAESEPCVYYKFLDLDSMISKSTSAADAKEIYKHEESSISSSSTKKIPLTTAIPLETGKSLTFINTPIKANLLGTEVKLPKEVASTYTNALINPCFGLIGSSVWFPIQFDKLKTKEDQNVPIAFNFTDGKGTYKSSSITRIRFFGHKAALIRNPSHKSTSIYIPKDGKELDLTKEVDSKSFIELKDKFNLDDFFLLPDGNAMIRKEGSTKWYKTRRGSATTIMNRSDSASQDFGVPNEDLLLRVTLKQAEGKVAIDWYVAQHKLLEPIVEIEDFALKSCKHLNVYLDPTEYTLTLLQLMDANYFTQGLIFVDQRVMRAYKLDLTKELKDLRNITEITFLTREKVLILTNDQGIVMEDNLSKHADAKSSTTPWIMSIKTSPTTLSVEVNRCDKLEGAIFDPVISYLDKTKVHLAYYHISDAGKSSQIKYTSFESNEL